MKTLLSKDLDGENVTLAFPEVTDFNDFNAQLHDGQTQIETLVFAVSANGTELDELLVTFSTDSAYLFIVSFCATDDAFEGIHPLKLYDRFKEGGYYGVDTLAQLELSLEQNEDAIDSLRKEFEGRLNDLKEEFELALKELEGK